jgi:hypothetical protein
MWTQLFWMQTAERALKTLAQVLVVVLLAKLTASGGVDIAAIDWPTAFGLAIGAAVLSVVTSVASDPIGKPGPSLVNAPPARPPEPPAPPEQPPEGGESMPPMTTP